jgi:hypothetical protein
MHLMIPRKPFAEKGFSLVALMMLMALIVVVLLGMISLSNLELKGSKQNVHELAARANARMALMIAMGELQKHTGPDQRVTARAAILEGSGQEPPLANRDWLGVWKTTYRYQGQDWPLIGKASEGLESKPYSIQGAYQDLRHSITSLSEGRWKREQVQTWLVSKRHRLIDPRESLDESSDGVVRLLGRGTLGKAMSMEDFDKSKVLVEKVQIHGANKNGAHAWYISDNNQKACIVPGAEIENTQAALEAAPGFDPALIVRDDGEAPYKDFMQHARPHRDKIISYATASLSQAHNPAWKDTLAQDYHHFTTYSPGLFANSLMSGLRRDLTPLLLAHDNGEAIDLSYAGQGKPQFFSSSYPIIPGPEHGVLGPSFGALRDWAQHKYSDLEYAETVFDQQAMRMRPSTHWPHGISDGACADASKWAEHAPKIHPVMTECRWHYYFSHHNNRIRTHIVPRVCLWNPYNRPLKTKALSVVMPNPYYGVKHGMHFFPEKEYVEQELKSQSIEVFNRWVEKSGYAGGDVYKIRTNPFPPRRYLAFTLDPTILSAGQCQVFSPKVTGGLSSGGINIQHYNLDAVSDNVLSPHSIQGEDHFFYDHDSSVAYEIQTPQWKNINAHLGQIDFGRIFDYQPALDLQTDGKVENFPFMLKVGQAALLDDLYSSFQHPTIQLVNNGAGGAKSTKTFHRNGLYWGSANQKDLSFGHLQTFAEAPMKNAPHTHQVGAKLLWLNETVGEGDPANRSPHRHGTSTITRWGEDHMVYNVCPVANWNVRAQLVSRSPASQCANKWYMNSTGPWLLQFVPQRPMDVHDMPAPSINGFVKNPFGLAVDFSFFPNVVLFDLPSEDYGVISVASLRHAMLSPYSWSPSYLVGHSLRDMHAPADATAYAVAASFAPDEQGATRWDYLIGKAAGGETMKAPSHGARCILSDSQGLLQIGNQSALREIGDLQHTSADEVLAYDIAYEVNHNLWDGYFFSSMPLDQAGERFVWNPDKGKYLWNRRYQFNEDGEQSKDKVKSMLLSDEGVNWAFWRSAEYFKNRSAFNVNSTSVEAWTAFLSGTLGISRPLRSGIGSESGVSFARYRQPKGLADTDSATPDQPGGWMGARQLTADEVRMLAVKIVYEVKKRGPFVSIADFVNRRLVSDQDQTSCMGTIDAAIQSCGLNKNFERLATQLSTAVNVEASSDAPDNNMQVFKEGYRYRYDDKWNTVQPTSKAWGVPGFLTQGDILHPLAPFMAARGDTFTIRAYGESSAGGVIQARAWLEATVERTPYYVDHKSSEVSQASGNGPIDCLTSINPATGTYERGQLSVANEKWGRKYKLKSFRWLQREEI